MTTPVGYQQIVGMAASTALTLPTTAPQQPSCAVISASGAGVRWRDDGVAPTAAIGYPLAPGAELVYTGALSNLRFIQQVATATLDVSYYYGAPPVNTSSANGSNTGGAGTLAAQVQGNQANNTTEASNPVAVGGLASDTAPTPATAGQRKEVWVGLNGGPVITALQFTGQDAFPNAATSNAVNTSNGSVTLLQTANSVLNAAGSWDRMRGDTTGVYCVAAPSTGTDRSITATTASAQLMAANTSRHGFFIKNDTAIVVWINFGATAVATPGGGNIAIAANGGYYESPASVTPSSAINIIATSTTAAITAREF